MSEVKKCSKCGGEMEKENCRGKPGVFIKFTKSKSFWFPGHLEEIVAFACKRCGYIELYKESRVETRQE